MILHLHIITLLLMVYINLCIHPHTILHEPEEFYTRTTCEKSAANNTIMMMMIITSVMKLIMTVMSMIISVMKMMLIIIPIMIVIIIPTTMITKGRHHGPFFLFFYKAYKRPLTPLPTLVL